MRLFDRRKRKADVGHTAEASAPLARVRIDSGEYEVSALNTTTLTLAAYAGDLIARQRFQFAFRFELDGDTVEVSTSGDVLSTAHGRLVARYYAPQPYYQKVMCKALAAKTEA